MSISRLLKVVSPPSDPFETGNPEQWLEVEKRVGVPLPRDYKEFIGLFGTGGFNDFIYPFNPFTERTHLNLINGLAEQHEAERVKRLNFKDDPTSIVRPFELFPAANGLLPCGTTTNFGDYFFWQVKGDPDGWRIVLYDLRDGDYEMLATNFTGFISGVLTGDIVTNLLPDDIVGDGEVIFS